jgi:FlaA1/EpsC-like NDP-sugar epimerase
LIKQNQKYFNFISEFIDAVIIFLSIIAAWLIRFKTGIIKAESFYLPISAYVYLSVLLIPLFLFLYFVMNIYKSFRAKSSFSLILSIVKANSAGILIVILYLFITKQIDYSRYVLILFYIISTVLIISEKLIIRDSLKYIRTKGRNLKHIVFIGFGNATKDFIRKIDTETLVAIG